MCNDALNLSSRQRLNIKNDDDVDRPVPRRVFDNDVRITKLTVKAPGRLIQEKFLQACQYGDVIELFMSQESSSHCVIVDVQTHADQNSQRFKQLAREGRIVSIYSRPCSTQNHRKQAATLKADSSNNRAGLPAPSESTQRWDQSSSSESTLDGNSKFDDEEWPFPTRSCDSKKRKASNKKCISCDNSVAEEWMDRCKRCYA